MLVWPCLELPTGRPGKPDVTGGHLPDIPRGSQVNGGRYRFPYCVCMQLRPDMIQTGSKRINDFVPTDIALAAAYLRESRNTHTLETPMAPISFRVVRFGMLDI